MTPFKHALILQGPFRRTSGLLNEASHGLQVVSGKILFVLVSYTSTVLAPLTSAVSIEKSTFLALECHIKTT